MTNENLDEICRSARDFLSRRDHLKRVRAQRFAPPHCEREVWHEMAEMGWLSLLIPERLGGLGMGLPEAATVCELIGEHLLPEPFIAVAAQLSAVLCQARDAGTRNALLQRVATGRLIGGLAWQELLGQEGTERPRTTVRRDAAQWVLQGRKCFVTPAGSADGWLVTAMDGVVQRVLWVPAATPGVVVEETRCVDGSDMCSLSFEAVRLPLEDEIGFEDGESAAHAVCIAIDTARVLQGAELLGVTRRALALTIEHLSNRHQFGKPLGTFQALKHRTVDAWVQQELAAFALEEVYAAFEQDPTSLASNARRIKARCAHAATLVTRMAIQLHGAMGYTDECDVGLYFKRAMFLSAWLGNAARNRAWHLQSHPRAQVADDETPANIFPRDADWDAMPEVDFRRMLRGFFAKNYPASMRNISRRVHWREIKDWYLVVARQGWVAPAWPKNHGGMGLPPDKLLAFVEEQERYGVARAPDMGVVMIGPLLIQRGTPAQQQKFLPGILAGEHVWCQGYSEPGAGSDLASLRTEAVLDGDCFVVTGQKIWTTLAQDATHMFALVRTDKNVKKQAGISFLLVDLAEPGITIRPIGDLGGDEEFCEVFLDRVRVPRENLVGALNEGWTIAKTLLGFERIFLGSPKQSRFALSQLDSLAQSRQLFDSPAFAARYAELQLDVIDLSAAYAHFADLVKRNEPLPVDVSLLKIWASETYQRIMTFLAESADEDGGTGPATTLEGRVSYPAFLINALPATIYGGSSEVQREIIAKNVLRLPE